MRHKKLVEYRRAEVSRMLILGMTQVEISKQLGCSQGLISTDVSWLDGAAAEELKSHVQKKLPHVHLIASQGIDKVIRTAWQIVEETKNPYVKVHALNLLHSSYVTKQNLASDGTVINNALELIKKSKAELKELKQEDDSFVDEAAQALTANLQALEKGKRRPPLTNQLDTSGLSFSEQDGSALEEGAIVIGATAPADNVDSQDIGVGENVPAQEDTTAKERPEKDSLDTIPTRYDTLDTIRYVGEDKEDSQMDTISIADHAGQGHDHEPAGQGLELETGQSVTQPQASSSREVDLRQQDSVNQSEVSQTVNNSEEDRLADKDTIEASDKPKEGSEHKECHEDIRKENQSPNAVAAAEQSHQEQQAHEDSGIHNIMIRNNDTHNYSSTIIDSVKAEEPASQAALEGRGGKRDGKESEGGQSVEESSNE
jgi:hypothetical protein